MSVARTDLVFDNKEILDLLFERGEEITVGDTATVEKIETKINSFAFKQKLYHTPVCGVFMTFENDKDVRRA